MTTIAENSSNFPYSSRLHQHMKSLFLPIRLSNNNLWYHQQLHGRVFAVCRFIMLLLLKPFQNFWQMSGESASHFSLSLNPSSVLLLMDSAPKVWRGFVPITVLCISLSILSLFPHTKLHLWFHPSICLLWSLFSAHLCWAIQPEKLLNATKAFLVTSISLFRSHSINPSASYWRKLSDLCSGPDWWICRWYQLVL